MHRAKQARRFRAILKRCLSFALIKTMNNEINIEVTLLSTVKTYTVNPCEMTGIGDKGIALLAARQAFIVSGMPLAKASLLKRHPAPGGVKAAEWVKTLAKDVEEGDFPTAENVWEDACQKAEKAYDRESKETVNDLKAKMAEMEAKLRAAGLL